MLCNRPYMMGSIPYGCGQCLSCRINRSRQWTWRQFLESLMHDENCFVTLTYADECLPVGAQLCPAHLSLFLKKLRARVAPLRFRYFAVGEYGDATGRPHYHLNLFGVSGFTVPDNNYPPRTVSQHIEECWPNGFVHVAEFNEATAHYVTGYVTKKLKDYQNGTVHEVPEFARMSNRPGIGATAMHTVATSLLQTVHDWKDGDVPRQLRIGRRSIPLGRYLLRTLRQRVGFTDEYIQEIKEAALYNQTLDLLAVFSNTPEALTVTEAYKKDITQKLLQVEARYKIWNSKRTL